MILGLTLFNCSINSSFVFLQRMLVCKPQQVGQAILLVKRFVGVASQIVSSILHLHFTLSCDPIYYDKILILFPYISNISFLKSSVVFLRLSQILLLAHFAHPYFCPFKLFAFVFHS